MISTERPPLNWRGPPEWDRFLSSVEQTHGATSYYAGFEIEQAWREYNEVHLAEEHVNQPLEAAGCRGQDTREKTPPTRDVSDGGQRVSIRVRKDVKEEMSEYADETGQAKPEVLRAVVCWHLDGGLIGLLTDKLDVAVPEVKEQLAELDPGNDRERTAGEKKRQWLAKELSPGEFTRAVFGEKLDAMSFRGEDTEYMREKYLQPVLNRINYTEHPNNADLFVPEEQAREYAEEQRLDPNAPAFERKPYGNLTDVERIHKLRVELALQAARHDGKHALRVGKVRGEVFDGTPGTRKVKDLMDRAADGASGFETDAKNGKRVRCDLEAVKDTDVLADAGLTAETSSTSDVDETDDDYPETDSKSEMNRTMPSTSSTPEGDGGMAGDGPGLGTTVIHRCETVAAKFDHQVVHIALSPRQPCATPLSDLRDAGHDVLDYGVFPEEIPKCSEATAYPGCEHLLLRPNDAGQF